MTSGWLEKIKDKIRPVCVWIMQPHPVVPVLRLSGVIGQGGRMRAAELSIAKMEEPIRKAFGVKKAKAVALVVNSPGGAPVQAQLIYTLIRQLSEEKGIPVIAFAEDVAASGGYWLLLAGDEVFVQESSIVGSIGVVTAGFGLEEFIDRHGIKRRMYTQGKNKAMLDPFLPEKEEDVQRLKAVQKDIHEAFVALVKGRRKDKISMDGEELFTGAFWSGKKAVKLGLADGIGDMFTVLKARFGEKVELKKIEVSKGWLSRKFGARAGEPEAWIEAAIDVAEARAVWARVGL